MFPVSNEFSAIKHRRLTAGFAVFRQQIPNCRAADAKMPASHSRPVQCFRLRARQAVCAMVKSVSQIEPTFQITTHHSVSASSSRLNAIGFTFRLCRLAWTSSPVQQRVPI
jgi:hypothetical protein